MIRYALKCSRDHRFESWFASGAAFDKLASTGMISCPECGTTEGIEKALMAPGIVPSGRHDTPARPESQQPRPAPDTPLSAPGDEARRKVLAELQARIEANADYVGMKFASEARAIHEGLAPDRPIYGETRPEEARALIEEGVPVAPLPFAPRRKTN